MDYVKKWQVSDPEHTAGKIRDAANVICQEAVDLGLIICAATWDVPTVNLHLSFNRVVYNYKTVFDVSVSHATVPRTADRPIVIQLKKSVYIDKNPSIGVYSDCQHIGYTTISLEYDPSQNTLQRLIDALDLGAKQTRELVLGEYPKSKK